MLRRSPRSSAAEQWLKKARLSAEHNKATVQEQVPLDPKQREALFREFATYQRAPGPEKATIHIDSNQREALFREFAQYEKQPHAIIAYRATAGDY
jgi:hypothetical protein